MEFIRTFIILEIALHAVIIFACMVAYMLEKIV